MPDPSTPPSAPPLDTIRQELETKKLGLEIRALEHPWRNGVFFAALLTAAVSLVIFVSQSGSSRRQYELAQIRTERFDLDAEKLKKKREALEADTEAMAREKEVRSRELAALDAKVRGAQGYLASTLATLASSRATLASSRVKLVQLERELRQLQEGLARARNSPALTGHLSVSNVSGGSPVAVSSGDTVFLGDALTVAPPPPGPTPTATPSQH
ncbi:MAG: hypothetical protein ACHQPI_02885 [Thermoanaerobaculia bacterium]